MRKLLYIALISLIAGLANAEELASINWEEIEKVINKLSTKIPIVLYEDIAPFLPPLNRPCKDFSINVSNEAEKVYKKCLTSESYKKCISEESELNFTSNTTDPKRQAAIAVAYGVLEKRRVKTKKLAKSSFEDNVKEKKEPKEKKEKIFILPSFESMDY